MATKWTDDPVVAGVTPIRVVHVSELRAAINCNRRAAGLSNYTWTDSITTSTPIRAIHISEMRDALAGLFPIKGLTLPNWTKRAGSPPTASTPIYADDITDLRRWVNQYENTGGFSGPRRGIHLRNAGDLRQSDLDVLEMFKPGLVVVLSTDVGRTNMFNYLKSIQNTVEIFIRHYPTHSPVKGAQSIYDPSYTYTEDYNNPKSPTAVAQDMINNANSWRNSGLTNFRCYPGNEPELEWKDGIQWKIKTWNDIQHYYTDIYDELVRLGRPAEIYPPALNQYGSLAVGNYNSNGTVTRASVTSSGIPGPYTGADGEHGVDYIKDMLDHYRNGTPVGRFNIHNYFWPGYQANHAVYNFFPQWLKDRLAAGTPNRVTEFGWHPDAVKTGACPDPQYCCPANLDTTTTSCDGSRTITSWGDYNDFVRISGKLDGYAVWLLSDASNTFPYFVAVREDGSVRDWIKNYICFLNA